MTEIKRFCEIKQIKTILVAVIFSLFFIPCFADNAVTGSGTECVYSTLNTYTGPSTIKANWDPNTINLYWYNDDQKLTVQTAANTCNYDSGISLPSSNPTKTGYTFSGWEVLGGVPTGYTMLQYLQSSGTQYIDTGVLLASDNIVYEWRAKDSSTSSGTSLFGAEYGSTRVYSGVLHGSKTSRGAWFGSTKSASMGYSSSDDAFHTWSWVINSDHTSYLIKDGTSLSTISWSGSLNKSNTIAIYCNHTASSFTQQSSVSYEYFRIRDNGTLVFNGIPAKRNSDNVLGMYDTVSQTFFTNAGSGTFTAGPAIQ